MPRVLHHAIESPHPCSYLGDRMATLENVLMLDVSSEQLETLLVRGWRRFGAVYFRPACPACGECVPIRIPTAAFEPSRTQRRILKRSNRFHAVIGDPKVDTARLALYRTWHAFREGTREWNPSPLNARTYAECFALPHPAAREVAYYDGDRLVGVGLWDQTPNAYSAIYFYYDPAYAQHSLGTFNVMFLLQRARAENVPHVYLGYRVMDCPSMRYKAQFRPHELLVGRPELHQEPQWQMA